MNQLAAKIVSRDRRALARALTMIENQDSGHVELLEALYPYGGRAHVIGFTGAPGAGKSTLVDQVIGHLRAQSLSIGVMAVDPSSPFTGGALLGDRVRMTRHSADPGVFIRSVGSRGSLGGLGKSTRDMLFALEAYGCDAILLETVGVGQSELDVMSVADTVALVLTPGTGDHVQTAKAGIMEIADVFVLNKRELPGADALARELQLMLRDRAWHREDWLPPIVRTNAVGAEGITELWEALQRHVTHLRQSGYAEKRRRQRHREDTLRLLESTFRTYILNRSDSDEQWQAILDNDQEHPRTSVEKLLRDLPWLNE